MITLFIDTCHYNLIVGIYKDNEGATVIVQKLISIHMEKPYRI